MRAIEVYDWIGLGTFKSTFETLQMCNQGRGELLLSVCHHPAANRLTVVVLKARNLPKMDITGLSGNSFHLSLLDHCFIKVFSKINASRVVIDIDE